MNGKREAGFGGRCPEGLATQRIFGAIFDALARAEVFAGVARADACPFKASDGFAALEEEVRHADVLAAPSVDEAALDAPDQGDLRRQRIVAARIDHRPEIVHVAADAGEILGEGREDAARRRLRQIARIVGNREADARHDGFAFGCLHRQRGVVGDVVDFFALEPVAQDQAGY